MHPPEPSSITLKVAECSSEMHNKPIILHSIKTQKTIKWATHGVETWQLVSNPHSLNITLHMSQTIHTFMNRQA